MKTPDPPAGFNPRWPAFILRVPTCECGGVRAANGPAADEGLCRPCYLAYEDESLWHRVEPLKS